VFAIAFASASKGAPPWMPTVRDALRSVSRSDSAVAIPGATTAINPTNIHVLAFTMLSFPRGAETLDPASLNESSKRPAQAPDVSFKLADAEAQIDRALPEPCRFRRVDRVALLHELEQPN